MKLGYFTFLSVCLVRAMVGLRLKSDCCLVCGIGWRLFVRGVSFFYAIRILFPILLANFVRGATCCVIVG